MISGSSGWPSLSTLRISLVRAAGVKLSVSTAFGHRRTPPLPYSAALSSIGPEVTKFRPARPWKVRRPHSAMGLTHGMSSFMQYSGTSVWNDAMTG